MGVRGYRGIEFGFCGRLIWGWRESVMGGCPRWLGVGVSRVIIARKDQIKLK